MNIGENDYKIQEQYRARSFVVLETVLQISLKGVTLELYTVTVRYNTEHSKLLRI
jgi:hypothetical protein